MKDRGDITKSIRFLSLLLAFCLTLGAAAAFPAISAAEADGSAKASAAEEKTPEIIADFNFDNGCDAGLTKHGDNLTFEDGAVTFGANSYLTVDDIDLSGLESMTVVFSFKMDPASLEAGDSVWLYEIASDDDYHVIDYEYYIGALVRFGDIQAERYANSGVRPGSATYFVPFADMAYVNAAVVYDADGSTRLYLDGALKDTFTRPEGYDLSIANCIGETPTFSIGRAHWGEGEFANGLTLDGMTVYDGAIDNDTALEMTKNENGAEEKSKFNGSPALVRENENGELCLVINDINFPGSALRQHITVMYDHDGDRLLTPEEVEQIKELNVSQQYLGDLYFENVTTLKGIEYFTSLEDLTVGAGFITNVDLSTMPKLKKFTGDGCVLKGQDFSNNPDLEEISCSADGPLDLSHNLKLKKFVNLPFNNQIGEITFPKTDTLTYIECTYAGLKSLDLAGLTGLETLICNNNEIESVKNLADCASLVDLELSYNRLTEIDLDSAVHTKLQSVYLLGQTRAEALPLTRMEDGRLEFDPSTAFEGLIADGKLSEETLKRMSFEFLVLLKGPDFPQPELTDRGTYILEEDPFTLDIFISYEDFASGSVMEVGFGTYVEGEDAEYDIAEYFPDPAFADYVRENIDLDGSGTLSASEIKRVERIVCSDMGVESFAGLELFTELREFESVNFFDISNTSVTSLDVSKNTKLERLIIGNPNGTGLKTLDLRNNTLLYALDCSSNELTELDLSNNHELWYLNCSYNNLKSLDLSGMSLEHFECRSNELTELDLSGQSELRILFCDDNMLTTLDVSGCPILDLLSCPNNPVKELDISSNPLITLLDIQNTNIPSIDVSGLSELRILSCSNAPLRSLDLSGLDKLEQLDFQETEVESVDLTGVVNLQKLFFAESKLTSLDLSDCPYVTTIWGDKCGLTSITFAPDSVIGTLDISENELTSLDLSNCPILYRLNCSYNKLTSLDTSKNYALSELDCSHNEMDALDLPGSTDDPVTPPTPPADEQPTAVALMSAAASPRSAASALAYLNCSYNRLTALDLSSSDNLITLICDHNNFTDISFSEATTYFDTNVEVAPGSDGELRVFISDIVGETLAETVKNGEGYPGSVKYDPGFWEFDPDTLSFVCKSYDPYLIGSSHFFSFNIVDGHNIRVNASVNIVEMSADSVTLDKTEITLTEGDTATLTATVLPENTADKSLTWESSDEKVVKVDANGKLTAVGVGTADITVTTVNGKTATCKVTVKAKAIDAGSVTLDKTDLTLTEGDTATLTATVDPANTTDKSLTWKSSDEKVVKVDANGKLTAVGVGTADITVTTSNGKTATCKVTVKAKAIGAGSVTLDKTEITLTEGDTATLTATVLPANTTDKSLTWKSSDEKVVKVDSNGKLTAVGVGTADITVTTVNGKTATCKVTVKAKVIGAGSVTLDKTELTLTEGDTATLTATVDPANTTDKSLTWKSSDEKVVKVDSNGKLTAVGVGTADITVTTSNGKSVTCKVTVKAAATDPTTPGGTTAEPPQTGDTERFTPWIMILAMSAVGIVALTRLFPIGEGSKKR